MSISIEEFILGFMLELIVGFYLITTFFLLLWLSLRFYLFPHPFFFIYLPLIIKSSLRLCFLLMETFVVSYKESSRFIRSPLIAEELALRSGREVHRDVIQSSAVSVWFIPTYSVYQALKSGQALLNYMVLFQIVWGLFSYLDSRY